MAARKSLSANFEIFLTGFFSFFVAVKREMFELENDGGIMQPFDTTFNRNECASSPSAAFPESKMNPCHLKLTTHRTSPSPPIFTADYFIAARIASLSSSI